MVDNYRDHLLITDIAKRAKLSPAHYARLFRGQTGLTAGQTLKSIRLHRAVELLAATSLTEKEIASRVGMGRSGRAQQQSAAKLIRAFREQYGVTPGKYRIALPSAPR